MQSSVLYWSLPPCRAASIARNVQKSRVLRFASKITMRGGKASVKGARKTAHAACKVLWQAPYTLFGSFLTLPGRQVYRVRGSTSYEAKSGVSRKVSRFPENKMNQLVRKSDEDAER